MELTDIVALAAFIFVIGILVYIYLKWHVFGVAWRQKKCETCGYPLELISEDVKKNFEIGAGFTLRIGRYSRDIHEKWQCKNCHRIYEGRKIIV